MGAFNAWDYDNEVLACKGSTPSYVMLPVGHTLVVGNLATHTCIINEPWGRLDEVDSTNLKSNPVLETN
jgi:hypothetical protein